MNKLKIIIIIGLLISFFIPKICIASAIAINRTTKQIITSADINIYPVSQWIHNPILPKCSSKYWKIVGDLVLEMSVSEKTAVDLAEAEARQLYLANAKDLDKMQKSIKVLAILTFKEINKLRVKAGLTEYTWTQFKNAFKTEWDALP